MCTPCCCHVADHVKWGGQASKVFEHLRGDFMVDVISTVDDLLAEGAQLLNIMGLSCPSATPECHCAEVLSCLLARRPGHRVPGPAGPDLLHAGR